MPDTRAASGRPLRDPQVLLYLAGQAASSFGDTALWLAAGIWVKDLTGSSARAGLTALCLIAPSLLSPFMGVMVDRWNRRRLMLVGNAVGAALVLLLLAVRGTGTLWLIYAVLVAYGGLFALLSTAQSALVTELTVDRGFASLNASMRTIRETCKLAAPAAGAAMYAAARGPSLVVVVDSASFIVAALVLLALKLPPRAQALHWPKVRWTAGLRHLLLDDDLRHLTLSSGVATLALGLFDVAIYAVVDDGLHRAPAFLGVLVLVQGAGSLAGGLGAVRLLTVMTERKLAAVGLTLLALGAGLLLLQTLLPVLIAMALVGAGITWVAIGTVTLLQRKASSDTQGQVYAAYNTVVTLPQLVSIAAAAGLLASVDYRVLLCGMLLSCLGALKSLLGSRWTVA